MKTGGSIREFFRRHLRTGNDADVSSLKPGDHHYRAFVGPPEKYDLVGANQFNLLVQLGLRDTDRLLDIGCGSLRAARLFIPYLQPGNYFGIEPEKWLVREAIRWELGKDIVRIKKPCFHFSDKFDFDRFAMTFDFALAHSIFSHASQEQIALCVRSAKQVLKAEGILAATFLRGDADYEGSAWLYPNCTSYKDETIYRIVAKEGFGCRFIDWPHPNGQVWILIGNLAAIARAAQRLSCSAPDAAQRV